jgi:peptidoglycan/LPS O-acetylase OafA/YrhL
LWLVYVVLNGRVVAHLFFHPTMSTLLATPGSHAIRLGSSPRVPAFDGIRGIAILLVLFDHVLTSFLGQAASPWHQVGEHGVTVFFVLSGYLITSKLTEDSMELRDFYIRRFFRLMPAAWAYLAFLLLLNRLTGVAFTSRAEVWSCIFFFRNFAHVSGAGLAGHFWSLSVEEQFYLVWPWVLLFGGIRRSGWVAATMACACALFRWVLWSHYDKFGLNHRTEVRADAILVGCLLALYLADPEIVQRMRRYVRLTALPAAGGFVHCTAHYHSLTPLCENLFIAMLISVCVLYPGTLWVRAVSWRPLAWLGLISYSVYLWQELFVHLGKTNVQKTVSLLAMVLFSLGSYYLIERPSIRYAARLTS